MEAAHRFVFEKMMTVNNIICRRDVIQVENLVSVTCKPGGGGSGVPVANISEWKFKLLV